MSDLLANLNPPQLEAVTLPPCHALILAGAGSGKTRVLTTRIAWLLSTQQVSPHGILAVTFTNKAAKEMTARLSTLVPFNLRGMWIGTFHGLCNRMLRAHYRDAGLPESFQILDTADQLAAIKRLQKSLNIDDEKYPPRELMHFINAHKEQGLRASQVEAYDPHTQAKAAFYAEYEVQCNREGVVDFAELLLRCHELLQRNEPLRQHYQQRFRHILIDEFQDTNRLQYSWLKLLAGINYEQVNGKTGSLPDLAGAAAHSGAVIFAVGDDDQSIYAFRGAEVGNMREFEREYAKQNVTRLEQNYRSHGNILSAANAIIKHNTDRLGKHLWTDAGDGEPLRVFEAYSDLDEARFIVDEIRELLRDGETATQIAILYRSNAQSRVIEHELFTKGVPYRVYGGLRFFERQEVKHALAYLRLIANPDDDTAFLRVVNFPTRGIGARSLENLQAAAHQHNSSLYNAAASLTGKAGASVGNFIRLIETLRQETGNLPLPEVIEHLIERSGLRQHYLGEKEGQERLANLDELVNAAAVFAQEHHADPLSGSSSDSTLPDDTRPSLEVSLGGNTDSTATLATTPATIVSFLAHASLEAGEHQAGEGQEAIQMMSVHSAKGLEFNVVFITGLEQGLFPHENAVQEGPKGLEEERRLMYVAITRARRRLYLSLAQSRMLHGQTRYCVSSLFLDELPPELLKRLNTRSERNTGFDSGKRFGGSSYNSAPAPKQQSAGGLRIGQVVRHAKFGQGVIVAAEGKGSDARLQINFGGDVGMKWLLLEYAKLETVG